MKLSQYKFALSPDLIAKHPAAHRDESRLLVLHKKTGKVEHKVFKDILNYFNDGDVMVFNNTKVFPARLYGNKEKTGAQIEIFLLRELNREQRLWDVLVDPARKIRIGNKLYFGNDDLVAEVIDNTTSRGRTLRFLFDGDHEKFRKVLYKLGETPIPRWVRREVVPEDIERYQTIFAKHEGAVAAPFAGLHFSRELMKRLEIKGINFAEITLHLGMGTFRSIDVEDLTKHKMDSEQLEINEQAANVVNVAKAAKKNVCAVGVTSFRALETNVTTLKTINPYSGWTNKFLFPPYEVFIPNRLITNFHLPYSTLLMMVSAFAGYDLIMSTYHKAIREKYRFGSYGDAMMVME
ncbi:MAG: tRNA preQ1(34) S-adenosylmethionine ribosyltransferase-isomerase QueA [Prevotellaceae bacterium]|jgi:S-adenosylmethionine:tRNA ribosyltransferase-isomerase|nr:tRNA preQ1(34) S-adenosylmethionine ribosyltransferase-isomerase QueA [Prevotellaceae bacterium]